MPKPKPSNAAELTPEERSFADPALYAEAFLGEDLWDTQQAILRALAEPNAQVAVRACHSSSKTRTAGDAVNWFMVRYPDGIAVTTAPTWHQVKDLTWKEIAAAQKRCRIQLPEANTTDWKFSADHYATGISTTEAERFQGFHAPHVLVVIDEAAGVPKPIWDAIDGIRAGGDVRVLALANPTISHGPFFDAFGKDRRSWQTFTISAFDTPNLRGLTLADLERMDHERDPQLYENARPYMTTRQWVLEMSRKWGTRSQLWTARVLGLFPSKGDNSLIALDWVERARMSAGRPGGRSLGVDVARFGTNYTSYALLNGNEVRRMWRVQGRDTVETAQTVLGLYKDDPLLSIVVDDSGVGGGVVDQLRAQDVPVIAFNAGSSPLSASDEAGAPYNRGAESYWQLSKALENEELALNQDLDPDLVEALTEQLVGVEYGFDAKQKVHVYKAGKEDKLASPDLADALNMAWAAHTVEEGAAVMASVQIVPDEPVGVLSAAERNGSLVLGQHDPMGSWRDRPGFWSGFGRNRGQLRGPNQSQDSDPVLEAAPRIICPGGCGSLANMRELGRVEGIRNWQVECPECGHRQVLRLKAEVRP